MNTISLSSPDLADLPKYKAVALGLRRQVENGTLEVGAKLPPVRDLAWELKITPGTVARAYSILTDEGLLEAVVGRGTFVANKSAPPAPDAQWIAQTEPPKENGAISLFSPKLPDMGQVAAIREAMAQVGQKDPTSLLNYPSREGYRPAREAVVRWLSAHELGGFDHDDIVLAHGGQNAISLVMQTVLRGEQPVVLVEDLSYAGFRRAAELLRAKVIGLPSDARGVIPEALEAAIRAHGAQLFCTSPEVHNPTGLSTPMQRRRAIATVIRNAGIDLLEDDCYRMGPSAQPGYRALLPQNAWYITSISKTLTPALRVGFAVAPRGRSADLRRTAEFGFFGLARPLADIVEVLLGDPRTFTLSERIRAEVGRYIRVAVNQLGGFDLTWDEDVPFLWLRLPSGWRASAFVRKAEAEGVLIRSADEFAVRDARAPHAVRIAINAQMPIERFDEAMSILRKLLDNPSDQISI